MRRLALLSVLGLALGYKRRLVNVFGSLLC